mmetsp:Transcript_20512/g.48181  ORF Transcript_20512/g.48181 Transcript_20512/m.48181 type:complete len:916 (-) Transcript_20512:8-2755(-)
MRLAVGFLTLSTKALWPSLLHLHVANAEESCPGGVNEAGQCVNPSFADESSSWDSSSDDEEEYDYRRDDGGNPHAHFDEDHDPEGNQASCNSYMDLRGHRDLYASSSFYQEINWSERVSGNEGEPEIDVCMSLDDIVQICSSYRPNYHEPFVHFPAVYLKEFKRVAFIGGGDSMLLHEALKYPSVELVLGLELDQKNVRESFRFFRTEPHFDDARVQWWFGDAAKSLNLLPREWFGTFDLVMVDLSETGMSLSVNKDLDIFSALALLLKTDGIMVKNEDYFGQMSKYFDHSVSVYMDDYPVLCDQDWAMGSNGIDFLHPNLDSRNEVKTLAYFPSASDHYRMIIDYGHNREVCSKKQDKADKSNEDAKAPTSGILLVAEVDTLGNEVDFSLLGSSVKKTVEALGLSPMETSISASSQHFFGLEEGYIAMNAYPGKLSIGLEILLWSKYFIQDTVLSSLLELIGPSDRLKAVTSYRVIHGGMGGLPADGKSIGPVTEKTRNCIDEEAVDDVAVSTEAFNAIVGEAISLLPRTDNLIAVLCGTKGVDDCSVLGSLAKMTESRLIAIWSCADNYGAPNAEVGKVSHVFACGQRVSSFAEREEGFSALVVDPSAGQLVNEVIGTFCKKAERQRDVFRNKAVLVTPLSNDAERDLFARCNRYLTKALNRGSTIRVESSKVGIVSARLAFVRELVGITESVAAKTGLEVEIDQIKSGPVPFQNPFEPEVHSADAYDQSNAMEQYVNQKPFASQSIYQISTQLETSDTKNSLAVATDGIELSSQTYYEVGNGSVAVAAWEGGRTVISWDGFSTMTVNIMSAGETYGEQRSSDEAVYLILLDHDKMVERIKNSLSASSTVASREHMPRGSNRVVNFKHDIKVAGCADNYESCKMLAREAKCNSLQPWMQKFCALSCGSCSDRK